MSGALMFFPPGKRCAGCATRRGTEASKSPETIRDLRECIGTGEPFYCHESAAVRDPNGDAHDKHGTRYRRLPQRRWRLCRGWAAALAKARGEDAS